MALYRKYRPSEIYSVVGQEETKRIISNAVINNMVSHAYIFYGPRGTGKTTMAKILAKMVNCENLVNGVPCGECNSCKNIFTSNDVVEIDAASNNGVDEIRDLREKVNLVPSICKYKVYIIDEVHMLSTQAFNALLKTLEEPPSHVIFILATTEVHKIPLTIASRCQKFQFTKISDNLIVDRLKEIAKLEKISVKDDALMEIAKISNGGMRDSINLLDQLRTYTDNDITSDDVFKVCGTISYKEMADLFINIKNNDIKNVVEFIDDIEKRGINYTKIIEDMLSFLKDILLYVSSVDPQYIKSNMDSVINVSKVLDKNDLYMLLHKLDSVMDGIRFTTRPSILLTTGFIELSSEMNNERNNEVIVTKNEVIDEKRVDSGDDIKLREEPKVDELNEVKEDIDYEDYYNMYDFDGVINNTFALASKDKLSDVRLKWNDISNYLVNKKYNPLVSLLVDTEIRVCGDNYLIISSLYESNVLDICSKYDEIKKFIKVILESDYNYAIVTEDKWNILKDEYIKNIHDGNKYEVRELNIKKDSIKKDKKKDKRDNISSLIDIVGEDIIEYK